MPNSRSRSPRIRQEGRPRSRSPRRRRDEDKPRHSGGGFKWKERRRDEEPNNGGEDRRLERGYRDRDQGRPKSPYREVNRENATDGQVAEKPKKEKKERREKKSGPVPTEEPMIIVNVNDRLGTKASIPCLASDSISKSCH